VAFIRLKAAHKTADLLAFHSQRGNKAMFETLISGLYAANVFGCLAAYLPQALSLRKQLRTDKVDLSVSIQTWMLWPYCNSVTFLFSFAATDSWEFQLIASANFVLSWFTLFLAWAVHRRYHQLNQLPSTASHAPQAHEPANSLVQHEE